MTEDEKAKLYKRIVQANEHVLLERMRIHGFWPLDQGLPADPAEEAAERAEIEAELDQLRKQQSQVDDPDKALAAERKRRWEESKKRRAEAKAKKEEERKQRRQAWDGVRRESIVHTGVGVSGGLQGAQGDEDKLRKHGLPEIQQSQDLAKLLGIELKALRWLTYHRRGATLVHYHRYSIAKKTGGLRFISAPKTALANAQRWILEHILKPLEVGPAVHGFVPGRSIVTNALPHVQRRVVANIDLKDFFPSLTFRRVKGLYQALGYNEHVATMLSLLCTEPPRVAAELDGKVYYVALGERVLPQGACTSPAITNAICRRLDSRFNGLAQKHLFYYTRYADDLTFSGDRPNVLGRLLKSVRSILAEEGFTEHPGKTRIMRHGRRQEVTGVTVNEKPSVGRKELRTLRAILHNAARHGLASQNRDNRPDFRAYLRGRVEFVCMVNPQHAEELRAALAKALQA